MHDKEYCCCYCYFFLWHRSHCKSNGAKLSISISSEYGRLEDGEILLRGLDDTWSKPNVTVLPTCWQTLKFNGKLGHIAAIVRQLNSKGTFFSPRGLLIRPSEILYFDDDLKNCEFSIKAQICTAAIPLCETNDLNEIILEDLENYYIHHTGFQKLTVEHARAVALEPGSCCSVM